MKALNTIREECENNKHGILPLAKMFEPANDKIYRGVKDGAIWRLVFKDEHGMLEEVITSIQGILCKAELPPFNNKEA